MGIDIYLKWDGQSEQEKRGQFTGFSTRAGNVGYLREAYHGGPYATKILVREAFEAENYQADIPAAVMRARLTEVTEPARNCEDGDKGMQMIVQMLAAVHGGDPSLTIHGRHSGDARTTPMTVEEAVRIRHKTLYNDDNKEIETVVQSYRDFVELAEQKEKETGKPCTVYASY
jgi:hypothetical protein